MDAERTAKLEAARAAGKTIGLVQGSWDMFHLGHLCYLQKARRACDFLVIAMDDDEKIRHRKGSNRPIIPLEERYQMIERLNIADILVVKHLGEPHWGLIRALKPDVLIAIKENYSDNEVKELEKICGEVRVLPRQAATSTSEIIRRTLIANGVKALLKQDPRVSNAVQQLKERLGDWEKLPEPWGELINYAERSTDWIAPTASCCFWNGKWRFGTNKIDQSIPKKDIEKRSELLYSTVEHGEINMLKKMDDADLSNAPVYTILFPCDQCMKTLIDKGVKTIYYLEDHPDRGWSKRSHERAEKKGIRTVQVRVNEDGEVVEREDGAVETMTLEESNAKYGQFKYIDPRNAREQNQLDVMKEFEEKGLDPLAPENVNEDEQEVLMRKKYWYVVKNRYPYPEVEQHIAIFANDPIYDIDDVTPKMWAELQTIWKELREQLQIPGGAFCFRWGDTLRSGASLRRVHAHVITPTSGKKTRFSIGCSRLGIKDGLKWDEK